MPNNHHDMSQRLILPPVTVPFKWLVAVMTISGSALCGVVTIGIWVGSQSTKVEAHDRDIIRLRDTTKEVIPKIARIEGILEYAFPKQAEKFDANSKDH